MSNGGEWRQYPTSPDGFYLNVGRAFSGDVQKLADGTWQADLNGKRLAGYGTRDAAMERVEYEIITHMRLAMNDLNGFRLKRPAAWDGKVWK